MLQRMSSKELSEWMAYYQLQANPQVEKVIEETPEAQAEKLKAALFKGK